MVTLTLANGTSIKELKLKVSLFYKICILEGNTHGSKALNSLINPWDALNNFESRSAGEVVTYLTRETLQ